MFISYKNINWIKKCVVIVSQLLAAEEVVEICCNCLLHLFIHFFIANKWHNTLAVTDDI